MLQLMLLVLCPCEDYSVLQEAEEVTSLDTCVCYKVIVLTVALNADTQFECVLPV